MTVYVGTALAVLREMASESVHCVVTSPPYWGLRDYGASGQLGLEPTPEIYVEHMVEVFREVRRVLRRDGTCWLNLGDSYNTAGGLDNRGKYDALGAAKRNPALGRSPGLKPKDLVGIPWMVARALQQPYYVGKLKREADRAWLAGWLDGEGTVSFVERDRGPDHTSTHDVRVFFTNCDREPLDHFAAVVGGHVYEHRPRENRFGSRPIHRWQMGTHDAAGLLRELYPYLRTKKRQAVLIWTLYGTLRHKNGHARTPVEVTSRRREIAEMVRLLNAGGEVTLPAWAEYPPSPVEDGWWLRSDIVWSKPNPMPESVTDRPTKAHEYLFLLTKAPTYYYDADAVREAHTAVPFGGAYKGFAPSGKDPHTTSQSMIRDGNGRAGNHPSGRNLRSVWTIATEPTPDVHFATYPQALVIPCIKAGTSEHGVCPQCGSPWARVVERQAVSDRPGRVQGRAGDALAHGADGRNGNRRALAVETLGWRPLCIHGQEDGGPALQPVPATVLDPFAGSGTTLAVARRLGRHAVGIELQADYLPLIQKRVGSYARPLLEVR